MQPEKVQAKLVDFSPGEGKEVMAAIDAVLLKFSAKIVVTPFISPTGTIAANANILKIEPIAPEVNGVPSPSEYQNGGSETTATKTD